MKQIIFNKKDYKDYRDMYHDICVKLDKNRFLDWQDDYEDLNYNGNLLNEFLWYCHNDSINIILLNFNREKISTPKNYDDYEYNIIIRKPEEFTEEFPNNTLEYKNEE